MATKTLVPVLNLKGLTLTETTHEKYGTQIEVEVNGKSGKNAKVTVEVDGKLMHMSLGSVNTGKLDSDGNAVWKPVMRLQPIAASVPKAVPAESFKTAAVSKAPSEAELQEYKDFLAFKAMKAASSK